jgi:hypothetical protein
MQNPSTVPYFSTSCFAPPTVMGDPWNQGPGKRFSGHYSPTGNLELIHAFTGAWRRTVADPIDSFATTPEIFLNA